MAMTTCKECKKEVSTSARSCPHCGTPNPAVGWKESALSVAAILIIGWFIYNWAFGEKTEEELRQESEETEKCKQDIQCWGKRNHAEASVYCAQQVERLAKYSARWTDAALEPKFSTFAWLNKDNESITFFGDKIEFQNALGAYQTHVYECDFDTISKSIISVRAHPGRL